MITVAPIIVVVILLVFLPMFTLVELAVPILRAVAVAVSIVGVRILVSIRALPLIHWLAVCWVVFWFWIKSPASSVGALASVKMLYVPAAP